MHSFRNLCRQTPDSAGHPGCCMTVRWLRWRQRQSCRRWHRSWPCGDARGRREKDSLSPSWHCFTGTASRRTVALSEPRAERAAGPRERAVRTLQGAPHRTMESLRTDRSLRPSFWRTPAPVRGSECASGRTVALSEPRAERAAGPRERAVRTLQGAPHRTIESLRTDRSLRPSFWRTPAPVRGSEPASGRTVALSATRAERAAGPRERAVRTLQGAPPSDDGIPPH